MSDHYLDTNAPGFKYGVCTFAGVEGAGGEAGQCVALTDDDTVALNADSTARSFGLLVADAVDTELCSVACCGGIYETDNFTEGVAAGDELACASATSILDTAGEGDVVIGEAISVVAGVLRFKLLV